MDERQQQRILGWLADIDNEEILGGVEDDDEDAEHLDEVSYHDTDSEQDCDDPELTPKPLQGSSVLESHVSSDDEENIPLINFSSKNKNFFIIKKKGQRAGHEIIYKWRKTPFLQAVRTRQQNIVTEQPGPQGSAREISNPIEAWSLFVNSGMLQLIVEYTNIKITSVQINYERERDCELTNISELKALIGILYLIGLHKSSHTSIDDIWGNDGTGIEIIRAVMSKQRFQFLLRVLRFDDIHTRLERNQVDKLAPIRQLYEEFVLNCDKNYKNTEYVTIDEMLEAFRGSCRFRQYIPSKPAKYGIKLFSLVDAITFYTKKLEIYVGQQPEGPYRNDTSTKALVKRMVEPISGTGRNVTMDNWFTSIPLAEELRKDHNLTVVGTVRKNKPEVPNEFKQKGMERLSTIFGFTPTSTLLSYCPKKDKTVILLSTMHHQGIIDETSNKRLPEIISFYNKTKGGVDVVDKLIGSYSVARICNRWPLRLFFTFLDVGSVNAHIILGSLHQEAKIQRKTFLKTLAFDLVGPQLRLRSTIKVLPRELQQSIKRFVPPLQEVQSHVEEFVPMKKRCIHCPRRTDRKFKTFCHYCKGNTCPIHTKSVCTGCIEREN